MKKLTVASLFIFILIAGCGASSNDSQNGISITATQPTAWEGSGDYLEFVIDIGSPNETASNIVVYFNASGTALERSGIDGNTDLQNGYVEIPAGHHHKAIRIEGFTSDGIITETQPITLRITGCSSAEYPIGTPSEATAIIMDGDGETVTDIDGNVYRTVLIGSQIWTVENLKTSKLRDGTPLGYRWNYWVYKDKFYYGDIYGYLYKWNAVSDPRGLAPEGWHIPSNAEWTQLIDYLGGEDIAGKKMKSTSDRKDCDDDCGTNESGFTALPGGAMSEFGYTGEGILGLWWSSTSDEEDDNWAWDLLLDFGSDEVKTKRNTKSTAMSVRCIKD